MNDPNAWKTHHCRFGEYDFFLLVDLEWSGPSLLAKPSKSSGKVHRHQDESLAWFRKDNKILADIAKKVGNGKVEWEESQPGTIRNHNLDRIFFQAELAAANLQDAGMEVVEVEAIGSHGKPWEAAPGLELLGSVTALEDAQMLFLVSQCQKYSWKGRQCVVLGGWGCSIFIGNTWQHCVCFQHPRLENHLEYLPVYQAVVRVNPFCPQITNHTKPKKS